MKLSLLRKYYPFLHQTQKNIHWRPITDAEIQASTKDFQVLANCYEESVRHVLALTPKGKEILKKRIKISTDSQKEPAYKIKYNVNGKEEIYRADKADYYGKFWKIYNSFYGGALALLNDDQKRATLSAGTSITISKMIEKHPTLKPILSRLYLFPIINNYKCEHNLPSRAFQWFTGKKPIALGETDLSLNLEKHEEKILDILENYDIKKDCFVVMTGLKKVSNIDRWHCLPITGINKENKTIEITNKRFNEKNIITYEELISKFKAIIGMRLE